jgi:hypothetical protein
MVWWSFVVKECWALWDDNIIIAMVMLLKNAFHFFFLHKITVYKRLFTHQWTAVYMFTSVKASTVITISVKDHI